MVKKIIETPFGPDVIEQSKTSFQSHFVPTQKPVTLPLPCCYFEPYHKFNIATVNIHVSYRIRDESSCKYFRRDIHILHARLPQAFNFDAADYIVHQMSALLVRFFHRDLTQLRSLHSTLIVSSCHII